MTTSSTERYRDCAAWVQTMEAYLLDPKYRPQLPALSQHLNVCHDCQAKVGGLLQTDDSLTQAFEFLEENLPTPREEQIDRILSQVRESSETARLLKRIRRPVNTILWLTVFVLSLAGLATLAWCVYWLIEKVAG